MRSLLVLAATLATAGPAVCGAKTIMDYLRTDERLYEAKTIAEDAGILDDIDPSRFGTQLTLMLPSNEAFDQLNADKPKWRSALVNNKQNVETVSKSFYILGCGQLFYDHLLTSMCLQLILFAASDMVVTPSDIRSGKWEAEGSIVSLLSETASIAKDGYVSALWCTSSRSFTTSHVKRIKHFRANLYHASTPGCATSFQVCVTDYTRTTSCDDPDSLPCCAMADLDNVIKADDGYIYIIDAVLMPQEIVDKMP